MAYHIIYIEDIKALIEFAEDHAEHFPSTAPGRTETVAHYTPEHDLERMMYEWGGTPIQRVSQAASRLRRALEMQVDMHRLKGPKEYHRTNTKN